VPLGRADKAWSFTRLSSLAQGQQSISALGLNDTTQVLQVKLVDCALMLLRVSWSQGFVYRFVLSKVSLPNCSQPLSAASLSRSEPGWQKHVCNCAASLDKGNYSYERQQSKS